MAQKAKIKNAASGGHLTIVRKPVRSGDNVVILEIRENALKIVKHYDVRVKVDNLVIVTLVQSLETEGFD